MIRCTYQIKWDQVNRLYVQISERVDNVIMDQISVRVWDQVGRRGPDEVRSQIWDQVEADLERKA